MDVNLRVRGLHVRASVDVDLRGLDLTLERGEAAALTSLGPADLPRLFRVLAGLEWPEEGEVVRGELTFSATARRTQPRLRKYRTVRKLRMTGGILSPTVALINNLDLFDNIALPLRYHFAPSERVVDDRTGHLLERLGLSDHAGLRPAGLTPGILRRAQLARALILEPTMLFVESTLSDVDNESTSLMLETIREYLDKRLLSVLVVSYDPRRFLPIVRRVHFILGGKIVGELEGRPIDEKAYFDFTESLKTPSRGEE